MKLRHVTAAVALGAMLALAFAGWLKPDNVFALATALTFCQ